MIVVHPRVPGNGPPDARLLILGEAPGSNELRERAPMVGATGAHVYRALGVRRDVAHEIPAVGARQWQNTMLAQLGVYIDNARCFVETEEDTKDSIERNRACLDHLQIIADGLKEVRVVLCVGSEACARVLGRGNMTNLHGSVWRRDEVEAMARAGGAATLRLPPRCHTVVCSYHPAFAMRGLPQAWEMIYRTIARAKAWAQKESGPVRRFALNLLPTPDDLRAAIAPRGGLWSIDIETPRDNHAWIKMVGLSVEPDSALVFPWSGEFVPIFREALARRDVAKVGHNFSFDHLAFLMNLCPVADSIIDTIQAESLLRPPFKDASKRRWLNLATCCQFHLDDWPYHKEPNDPATRAFYQTAFPNVPDGLAEQLYCALDTIGTRRLWSAQVAALKREGMWELYSENYVPNAPTLVRMEEAGVKIDEALKNLLHDQTEERIDRLKREVSWEAQEFHDKRLARLATDIESSDKAIEAALALMWEKCPEHPRYNGYMKYRGHRKCGRCVPLYEERKPWRESLQAMKKARTALRQKVKLLGAEFKASSSDQWRALLFNKDGFGLTPTKRTATKGLPSVDDDSLEELQRDNPNIGLLAKRVELQHLSRRLRVVLEVPIDEEGFAHFAFSLHRASTGRSSSGSEGDEEGKYRKSGGGNLQNWRAEDRVLIVPRGAEYVIGEADYAQIELRVMAWLARDMKLLAALHAGADIHSMNAAAIFGCVPAEARAHKVLFEGKMVAARYAAKRFTHGVDYGMQAEKAGTLFKPAADWTWDRVLPLLRQPEHTDFLYKFWRLKMRSRVLHAVIRLQDTAEGRQKLRSAAQTILAQRWIDAYFAQWPGLRAYQKEVIIRAMQDGKVVTPFGRVKRVQEWKYLDGIKTPRDPEDIIAAGPQSVAGEIARGRLKVMEETYAKVGGQLRIFAHDSFTGDLRRDAQEEFVGLAKPLLECAWPQMGSIEGFGEFRCPADFSFGENWGKHSDENPRGLKEW